MVSRGQKWHGCWHYYIWDSNYCKTPLASARDLLLIFLIDQKRYNEVTWLDHGPFFFILFPPPESLWFLTLLLISLRLKLVPCLALFDWRTWLREPLIFQASSLYYYSLSYELTGGLDEIRGLVFFCHDYLIIRD